MTNNFEEEIKVLENSNIRDREIIFYIYTDFYKDIITSLNFCYKFLIPQFREYLKSLFTETIVLLNFNNDNIDYCSFFINMLSKIRDHIINLYHQKILTANCVSILTVIDNYLYKIEPLNSDYNIEPDYFNTMQAIVKGLNSSRLDFYTKAHTMLIIKEHLNNFSNNFNSLYNTYNQETIAPQIMKQIIDEVISLIPKIINKSDGFEKFKRNLQKQTLLAIDNKFENSLTNHLEIIDLKVINYYVDLNNESKEIFWALILIILSGYEEFFEDFLNFSAKNKPTFSKFKCNIKSRSIAKELRKLGYNTNIN